MPPTARAGRSSLPSPDFPPFGSSSAKSRSRRGLTAVLSIGIGLGLVFQVDVLEDSWGDAARWIRKQPHWREDVRPWLRDVDRNVGRRLDAAEIAWEAAPDPWNGITWAANAVFAGGGFFVAEPVAILQRDPDQLSQQVIDVAFVAATHLATSIVTSQLCTVAGVTLGGPAVGEFAGFACMALAPGLTTDLREGVHRQLFGRPLDRDAAVVGAVVGNIAGMVVAMPLIQQTAYGSYAGYERATRSMTEATMRAQGAAIDPQQLRSATHHLHHRIPVRCGYALGIPSILIASAANLEIITAQANQAIGAAGCAG